MEAKEEGLRDTSRIEGRIKRLLEDIYELRQRVYYGGNYSTSVEYLDLTEAIRQSELTPNQAKVVQSLYVDDLEREETASLLNVTPQRVSALRDAALRNIAKVYLQWEELERCCQPRT